MSRVLVVDDDPAVRYTLKQALKRAGHDAVVVADGRAAIDAIETTSFDAVVTDICMPERDGLDLMRGLRAAQHPVPVVAMSGGGAYGIDGPLPIAELLGAKATLRKPFAPAELIAAVEAIIAA